MDMQKAKQVQQEVCDTAKAMADSGLTAGTWGNISGRIDDTYMVITPSGMDYSKLNPDQMVIVNMKTEEYEGNLKPSIEVPLHAKLLLTRPEVNGIVHTHSSKALAVAVTRKGIPPICDDQVSILGGDVRCAPYTFPGTPSMADTVAEALLGRMGALIANHGSIAMGRNLREALIAATVLEKTAQIWIDVQALGNAEMISDEDCAKFYDFFMNKYGQKK
ncbi:MAG: class II aldolase/adducin family protein [Clostridia bacterium]|nr:class II aldolase/adducin family protein [Clostridia bacterium]